MYALEEYRCVQSKGENNLRPILYVRDPWSQLTDDTYNS